MTIHGIFVECIGKYYVCFFFKYVFLLYQLSGFIELMWMVELKVVCDNRWDTDTGDSASI